MRLTLRSKLLLFAIAIAIVPLLVAGRTMIRIAQDELKSSANEQLVGTAQQLVEEINDLYERTWLAPLLLIRNAIDDESWASRRRSRCSRSASPTSPTSPPCRSRSRARPCRWSWSRMASRTSSRPAASTRSRSCACRPSLIETFRKSDDVDAREVPYIPQTDDWLATVVLPLKTSFGGGAQLVVGAHRPDQLRQLVDSHPFNRTGVADHRRRAGRKMFEPQQTDLSGSRDRGGGDSACWPHVRRSSASSPIQRPDGEVMLGAFAFPRPFDWAILVEKRQRDAYLAVEKMLHSLGLWSLIGLAVAGAGAIALALRISRPIVKIDRVAKRGRATAISKPACRASARATRSAIWPGA